MGHNTPISHHNSSIPLHSPLYTGDQLYHVPPGKIKMTIPMVMSHVTKPFCANNIKYIDMFV